MTKQKAAEIKQALRAGEKPIDIARRLHVAPFSVAQIQKGMNK